MIVRCAYDYDIVIHKNNKKGMVKKVKLSNGELVTITYPNSKDYFLRIGDTIVKTSNSFQTIEAEYIKECEKLKDSDNYGHIDIVKHKIVDNKVVDRF